MAFYPFYCETCECAWSVKSPMSKPAQRRKCPECGKMRKRVWDNPPGLKFIGDGWYVTDARKEKFLKEGYDKENAEEFYSESIKSSKKRMKSEYDMTWDDKRKMKRARKLTQETYEKTGTKPERPKHPQRMN